MEGDITHLETSKSTRRRKNSWRRVRVHQDRASPVTGPVTGDALSGDVWECIKTCASPVTGHTSPDVNVTKLARCCVPCCFRLVSTLCFKFQVSKKVWHPFPLQIRHKSYITGVTARGSDTISGARRDRARTTRARRPRDLSALTLWGCGMTRDTTHTHTHPSQEALHWPPSLTPWRPPPIPPSAAADAG